MWQLVCNIEGQQQCFRLAATENWSLAKGTLEKGRWGITAFGIYSFFEPNFSSMDVLWITNKYFYMLPISFFHQPCKRLCLTRCMNLFVSHPGNSYSAFWRHAWHSTCFSCNSCKKYFSSWSQEGSFTSSTFAWIFSIIIKCSSFFLAKGNICSSHAKAKASSKSASSLAKPNAQDWHWLAQHFGGAWCCASTKLE